MIKKKGRGRPSKPNDEIMKRLYNILLQAEDWLWVREISRRSNLPESTVRRYLNIHFADMIEEMDVGEDLSKIVKIRLVRLKPNVKEARKLLLEEK